MPGTTKHLVLDAKTHALLSERKKLTDVSIKELGNATLLSALQGNQICSTLGRVLVESGKLSETDFSDALGRALDAFHDNKGMGPVEDKEGGTLIAGSWRIRRIEASSEIDFQILECWAGDSNQLPMATHKHHADEFVIMLTGRSLIIMNGFPYTLGPHNMFQVPAGCVHTAIPLTDDCHLITMAFPSIAEYEV